MFGGKRTSFMLRRLLERVSFTLKISLPLNLMVFVLVSLSVIQMCRYACQITTTRKHSCRHSGTSHHQRYVLITSPIEDSSSFLSFSSSGPRSDLSGTLLPPRPRSA